MNAYRRLHHYARADYDAVWRQVFGMLARHARVPKLERIVVTVEQTCRRPPLPDPGATYPTVKAAIDGLVDARVISDDTGAQIAAVVFVAPERGEVDRLRLLIDEVSS